MSLCLFNLSESADRSLAAPGWFMAPVSHSFERHQTALRGPAAPPSDGAAVAPKRDAPETSPCRRAGHSCRTARSPGGVTALRWRVGGGIETPGRRWAQLEAASAQLVVHSVVGPPRSPA